MARVETEPLPVTPARAPGTGVRAVQPLAVALRPRQWLKNLLVLAAPLAAGSLLVPGQLEHVAVTAAALCLASSAGYLLNDVLDVEKDRAHPTKSRRPVAAGSLSVRLALAAAAVLAGAAVALALSVRPAVALVVLLYLALTAGYSLGLKRQAVFDLGLVAGAFVLRAVAGGVAAPVPLTQWFLVVASFGALFVVAGKRYADVLQPDRRTGEAWAVVPYSTSYLRFVWSLSATAVVVGYFVWSFDVGAARGHSGAWAEVSMAPFVLAVLRYAAEVDRGAAGSPEDVVLHDRALQVLGLAWLVTFAVAAHAL